MRYQWICMAAKYDNRDIGESERFHRYWHYNTLDYFTLQIQSFYFSLVYKYHTFMLFMRTTSSSSWRQQLSPMENRCHS